MRKPNIVLLSALSEKHLLSPSPSAPAPAGTAACCTDLWHVINFVTGVTVLCTGAEVTSCYISNSCHMDNFIGHSWACFSGFLRTMNSC